MSGNTSYVYQPLEMDIFHHNLIDRGIYVWEGRTCFLSTAHTDADLEAIVEAVKDSTAEMRRGGFWQETARPPKGGRGVRGDRRAPRRLPLTQAQAELRVLDTVNEGGSIAYNVSVALELRGHLRRAALEGAIQGVVDRHEALRCRFDDAAEVQEILPDVAVPCPLTDLSSTPAEERDSALTDWLEAHSRRAFDLAAGPLLRANLLRLEPDHHLLVMAAHHIVVDGWSIGHLLTEIAELYASACGDGEEPAAPALQLSDFVRRQEELRSSALMASQEEYWLQKLAGRSPELTLPADHQPPALRTYAGRRESARLSDE
ncbi:MAG: condensation domain-containing protein, partial [Acidobacteriota bacterium]